MFDDWPRAIDSERGENGELNPHEAGEQPPQTRSPKGDTRVLLLTHNRLTKLAPQNAV
jgi:hypothetical protein